MVPVEVAGCPSPAGRGGIISLFSVPLVACRFPALKDVPNPPLELNSPPTAYSGPEQHSVSDTKLKSGGFADSPLFVEAKHQDGTSSVDEKLWRLAVTPNELVST
jgi:hypothetical protein